MLWGRQLYGAATLLSDRYGAAAVWGSSCMARQCYGAAVLWGRQLYGAAALLCDRYGAAAVWGSSAMGQQLYGAAVLWGGNAVE